MRRPRTDAGRRVVAILLAVVAVSAGCTGGGGDGDDGSAAPAGEAPAWSKPGAGDPCSKRLPTPSPRTMGRYTVTPLVDWQYEGSFRLAHAWSHYIAYGDSHRVTVCDTDTGRSTVVARLPEEGAAVFDGLVGSADVVVLTRLSKVPTVGSKEGYAAWAVEARDMRTGRRWSVGTGPETDPGDLPRPDFQWPWVVYLQLREEDRKESETIAVNLEDSTRHVVATIPTGGRAHFADGVVVYDHITSADYIQRDLYAVPVDGSSPPRRLAALDGGQWPTTGDGLAAWHRSTRARSFSEARAAEAWAMPLDGSSGPVLLGTADGPRPGRGFVLGWVSDRAGERLVLFDPRRPGEAPVELVSLATGEHVLLGSPLSGDVYLWQEAPVEKGPQRLRVVRISAEPAAQPSG